MDKKFEFNEFLKNAYLEAIGHQPDYQIKLEASKWFDKGAITESDLIEIVEAINTQYYTEEGEMSNGFENNEL